jgi:NADP-dependent 3-hydroxy acid dehydrogenase YdfG
LETDVVNIPNSFSHLEAGLARWKGGIAIVTGASGGIGETLVRRLALVGMRVAAVARRGHKLKQLESALAESSGAVLAVEADLRHEQDIHRLFETVRATWGGVDVLVNNAGIGRETALATADAADWREMLDVNVLALSLCCREALQDMAGKTEAQIVNISSLAGHRVPLGRDVAFYSATKHAVKALTEGLREEMTRAQRPVRVCMISPGLVETEFHAHSFGDPAKARAFYERFKPLDPDDIADALLYMLAAPHHVLVHDIVLRPTAQRG